MSNRRVSGELEAEVLAALWSADRPLTVGEVVECLDDERAHNTVQTILTRLFMKGAVHREQEGRAHVYAPVLDEAGLTARRMRVMLERERDHAAVLSRFVGDLSADDERTLIDLIRGKRRPKTR